MGLITVIDIGVCTLRIIIKLFYEMGGAFTIKTSKVLSLFTELGNISSIRPQ